MSWEKERKRKGEGVERFCWSGLEASARINIGGHLQQIGLQLGSPFFSDARKPGKPEGGLCPLFFFVLFLFFQNKTQTNSGGASCTQATDWFSRVSWWAFREFASISNFSFSRPHGSSEEPDLVCEMQNAHDVEVLISTCERVVAACRNRQRN